MLSYEAAIDYIYAFTDYEKKTGYLYAPENFDLGRIERLLALLGSPHQKLRTVHIAGSKGKGSTSSMVASIMEVAGHRVGLFTSPHLHTFRERIRIGGQPIAPGEVARLIEEIRPNADQVTGITTFEVITIMALLYFHQREVDIAVLEVGLGGRLDATNVVTPDVSIITSLSYDHTDLLGDTLAEIAGEKAGIIKSRVPVVSSPQPQEALEVIEMTCQQKDAPLTLVGQDWTSTRKTFNLDGQHFQVCSRSGDDVLPGARACLDLWIPLLGEHQIVNATTAVAAIMELRELGWETSDADIAGGLHQLRWPGRLEILSREPMIVVDSAHNADSARKLIVSLKEHFKNRPILLIFGASSDKDIEGMLREFIPNTKRIIFTQSDHPRAADPKQLHAQAMALDGPGDVTENTQEALERALELAGPFDVICGAGSVFVTAALREIWASRTGDELLDRD
jgi:dihydrofolate synthase/folylpolyglutamate synthase